MQGTGSVLALGLAFRARSSGFEEQVLSLGFRLKGSVTKIDQTGPCEELQSSIFWGHMRFHLV